MVIKKITLKIPASAQELLKNAKSKVYKRMQGAITNILITSQGNIKRNIITGWGIGHKTRLPFFTGTLNRSITYAQNGLKGLLGSNMVYAEIQEYGGDIRPVRAKALFIPMSHAGRKRTGKLEYGKDFVLSQKATIKPKSYFKRGMEASERAIMNILDKMLADLGSEAGLK